MKDVTTTQKTQETRPPERPKPAEPAKPKETTSHRGVDRSTTSGEKDEGEVAHLKALQENYTPPNPDSPLRASVRATEGEGEIGQKPAHVGAAINSMLAGDKAGVWARPYLENVARMAWQREYGQGQGLEQAPPDYLNSWIDAWSGGDQNVPLARELNADLGRSPEQGAAYDWKKQFGADGLAPKQQHGNDCGVTAARAMMRASGIDADQEALFDDAIRGGYHGGRNNKPWNGPGQMSNFLRSHGVHANDPEALNWNRVNQELAAGRPVVLSTDAHYFVISGRDEQGRYQTGNTGAEINGRRNWTAAELQGYSGGHTLVTLKDTNGPAQPRPPAHSLGPGRTTNPRELWEQSPAPAAPTAPSNGNGTYTVQAGDTLWDIAQRNGTTAQELARVNGLANPDLIMPGQQFQLRAPEMPRVPLATGGANPDKAQIGRLADQAAQKYGIPADTLKAIFYKESTWNPQAVGDNGKSFGLGQVYTTVHPDFDVQRAKRDPAYQVDYSARMLADLYRRTGSWHSAVRSYNGSGPAAERYANDVLENLARTRPWRQWGVA